MQSIIVKLLRRLLGRFLMKNNIDECSGCRSITIRGGCKYKTIEDCPCENCLVKVVCTLPCPDLYVHNRKVWETLNKKRGGSDECR